MRSATKNAWKLVRESPASNNSLANALTVDMSALGGLIQSRQYLGCSIY
jgi:hypothetical protein